MIPFRRLVTTLAVAVLVSLATGTATGCAQTVAAPGSAQTPPAAVATQPIGVTDTAVSLPADGRIIHELSPWSMFMSADILVKAVMVSLVCASLVTWTILIAKSFEVASARRRLTADLRRVGDVRSIAEAKLATHRDGLVHDLLAAAETELEPTGAGATRASVRERAELRFADRVRIETQALRWGMGLLATIGAISPFVGLFGTVWGIMNSFIGISKSQTTNLAVVAPGIAEALLATATGLAAAIPAVIIYNHFSRATRSHLILVQRAVGTVTRLLSRELDHESSLSARAAE